MCLILPHASEGREVQSKHDPRSELDHIEPQPVKAGRYWFDVFGEPHTAQVRESSANQSA